MTLIGFLLGTLKISTVCLPVKFEKDETFESFKATVAGYGNYHKNGSMLPDWHQYSANGIKNNMSVLHWIKCS